MKPLVSWHYVIRIQKQYQTHSCNLPGISYGNYITLDTAMNSISVIAQGWCLHPGQLVKHDCKTPCRGLKHKKPGELCTNKLEFLSQPGILPVHFPSVTNSWWLHWIVVTDQEPHSPQSTEEQVGYS